MLVIVANKEPEDYGTLCHQSIASVLFVIQISGQLMPSVIPKKRHRAVGKETGKTSHIERFNNTMRQRISRQRSRWLYLSQKS